MAKQQSSETFKLPLGSGKARQARGIFGLDVFSRFEAQTWVLVVVSVVTAYLVLPPLYSVIQTSLFTTKLTGELDEFTLSYYRDMFRELQVLGPFLNTVYFSVGSALLATLLGGLVAWIVTRTDSPLRGLGYFTAFASFGTPFILYTIGWLLILGKAGPVNSWLRGFLDQSGPVVNVYSMWGMVFVEALLWSPFVFPSAGGFVSFHGPVSGRSLRRLRRAGLADPQADFAAAHAAGIFLRLAADLHSCLRVI